MEISAARFLDRLTHFQPERDAQSRALALCAGSVAISIPDCITHALQTARNTGVVRLTVYEIVLQSYLFLGFPRMLTAMDVLQTVWPEAKHESQLTPISGLEGEKWYDDGITLCEQVYRQNYPVLKKRVEAMAPEIFRWMIIEGYGKVLSRPGVGIRERELAIIAMLMIDQREKQLHSHIKGAFNIGADEQLVHAVVEDIGPAAGAGYDMALRILTAIGGQ